MFIILLSGKLRNTLKLNPIVDVFRLESTILIHGVNNRIDKTLFNLMKDKK
ncbi:hypothetical protein [Borreliella kurtenbachii]|uniref:hypothetical protein n=1 Tax=Borreliella kurtenbachii TaxID=1196056 RepID=UPI0034618631